MTAQGRAAAPDPHNSPTAARPIRAYEIAIALLTGGLLTFMVLLNGMLAAYTTPYFSSLAAHATGGVVAAAVLLALALLLVLNRGTAVSRFAPQDAGAQASNDPITRDPVRSARAPLWAYLGGISGAVTVMLTSITANSALALTGTLALGLAGQVVFGLICDRFGLFGLARRQPGPRDFAALGLILAGALMIIFAGGVA